jgi:O-antigen ligase
LLLIGTSVVLVWALATALSRGALIALLAGLLILAFAQSRRAGILAIGVAIVLVAVAYPLFVQWRVTADQGGPTAQAYAILAESDQARLDAALAGPQLFASAPLFGIGFGHYSFMSAQYVGFPIESHDWYLNVLAEEGIVGIALWVPMLVAVAIGLRRRSRSPRSVGYAVLATYAVGCAFLQPPDSVQTSALAVLMIVAAVVGDCAVVPADGYGRQSNPGPSSTTGQTGASAHFRVAHPVGAGR